MGQAGDNVGILIRGVKREDIGRGMIICAPGSVKTHGKFEAEVYVLSEKEGGRHTPFFSNYRPQIYMRTADMTASITLPTDVEMVMPGDSITATFDLTEKLCMNEGQ